MEVLTDSNPSCVYNSLFPLYYSLHAHSDPLEMKDILVYVHAT